MELLSGHSANGLVKPLAQARIEVLEDRLERQRAAHEVDTQETREFAALIASSLSNVPCDVYSNDRALRAAILDVSDRLDDATVQVTLPPSSLLVRTPARCP